MTQNANKEKRKIINKKFGIRLNYAQLIENFKNL